MSRSVAPILLLLAAAALLAPARGADSRLGLKLENVTCREAALALQRASDVPIEIKARQRSDIPGAVEPPIDSLDERSSFDWSTATFARAFRELADRYRLRPEPQRGGFALTQDGIRAPLFVYGTGSSTEARGTRLQVRQVGVSGNLGDQARGDRLSVRLHGIGPDDKSAATVIAVDSVAARDDRGGILRADAPPGGFQVRHTYPDEWSVVLPFEGLQPGATRLAWLEGSVIATPVRPIARLEAPLPLPGGGLQRRAGEGRVEFLELSPAARRLVPGPQHMAGPTLLLRLYDLDVRSLAHSNGYPGTPGPVLVGASGRTYSPPGIHSRGEVQDGEMVWNVTYNYPVIEEPLTGIRFEFGERGDPETRFTFRIRDVPLPGTQRGADTIYSGALFESDFGPGSRDFEAGGGVLVSPIRIGERPAPAGFLSVGLAPADGTGRTEWHRVEVATPPARIEGVRPGAYRVLRVYRPRESGSVAMPRWWLNGETVVQVEAGRETPLPPLDMPLQGEPPAVARAGGEPRNDRMVARVDDLFTSYVRSQELSTPPRLENRPSLELNLSGTGSGAASALVATLGNVVARDDRGNVLTSRSRTALTATPKDDGFEWRQQISLNAPHPGATRLSWLEGDLMAHGKPHPVEAVFPAPVPAGGAAKEIRGVRCEVDDLTSAPARAAPGAPASTEYLLRGRVRGLHGTRLEGRDGGKQEAVLIGKSGQVYAPERADDSRGSGRWEFRTRFVVPEPVTGIRLSLTVWPALQPAGSFRLTNVSLRTPRVFLPALQRPAPHRAGLQPPRAPYFPGAVRVEALFAAGGARLVLPVRIRDKPASGGLLSIGLAQLSGGQPGPLRWTEAEVVDGAARIEELKPGTYRLLRVYRVREEPRVKGPGRWEGAEARVTVSAGKETVAGPLRWGPVPGGPGGSSSGLCCSR